MCKVEEGERPECAKAVRQREMVERGERGPLAAEPDVGGAEIPHHRPAERVGECRPVADLKRAAPARVMRQRLAVKAHEVDPVEGPQDLGMGVQYDCLRRLDLRRHLLLCSTVCWKTNTISWNAQLSPNG